MNIHPTRLGDTAPDTKTTCGAKSGVWWRVSVCLWGICGAGSQCVTVAAGLTLALTQTPSRTGDF
ncbi:MAG: hypothetical protein E2O76_07300 [Caldithrix sp.]|nr:MAG: hypothetical protein E2O76_07300 [Caldithrix sp.]